MDIFSSSNQRRTAEGEIQLFPSDTFNFSNRC